MAESLGDDMHRDSVAQQDRGVLGETLSGVSLVADDKATAMSQLGISATTSVTCKYCGETANWTAAAKWAFDHSYTKAQVTALIDQGNNCTNFISQAYWNRNWRLKNSVYPSNHLAWHYNLLGPAGASYTWGGAHYNYIFVRDQHRSNNMTSIWNATPGDILYVSWATSNADSRIDHAMMVDSRVGSMPYISQQSPNRHHISLSTSIALANGPDQRLYSRRWYGQVIY